MTHYNVDVSRYKCLLMYLSLNLMTPVGTCKWWLVYKQLMNDFTIKQSS